MNQANKKLRILARHKLRSFTDFSFKIKLYSEVIIFKTCLYFLSVFYSNMWNLHRKRNISPQNVLPT